MYISTCDRALGEPVRPSAYDFLARMAAPFYRVAEAVTSLFMVAEDDVEERYDEVEENVEAGVYPTDSMALTMLGSRVNAMEIRKRIGALERRVRLMRSTIKVSCRAIRRVPVASREFSFEGYLDVLARARQRTDELWSEGMSLVNELRVSPASDVESKLRGIEREMEAIAAALDRNHNLMMAVVIRTARRAPDLAEAFRSGAFELSERLPRREERIVPQQQVMHEMRRAA